MGIKIKEHIINSNSIITCKGCKKLTMIKFLDNVHCKECEKIYISNLNKFINS